ncbi:MAG: fatty acid/phospholipid synthesis protein PlsX [Bacteroidetes bacterium]|nr:fatty acid/phospholipid synthesis protein PlsX [Bacteroidota bacterium]
MKIGIDIMGGDYAPEATVSGAILAYNELPKDVRLVLIGDKAVIEAELAKQAADAGNFDIVHAPEVIGMGEHPTKAFSQKPNSSISFGFHLLKEGKIDGFASNGNTGAMLVGSMFSVKSVAGVIRPCITSILPKENGGVGLLLDVGTNADCKPDVLYQFAVLGSLFAENVYGIKNPKVGLLNIGEEPEKGNLVSQAAHGLMKDSKDFNFIGNIEGRDIFNDHADVIVCDGFTGNVVLKEAEAFYTMIKKRGIKDAYFDRFNYEIYGGTPVVGINSTVMIGHGISSKIAVKNMLLLTKDIVNAKLADKIKLAFQ